MYIEYRQVHEYAPGVSTKLQLGNISNSLQSASIYQNREILTTFFKFQNGGLRALGSLWAVRIAFQYGNNMKNKCQDGEDSCMNI